MTHPHPTCTCDACHHDATLKRARSSPYPWIMLGVVASCVFLAAFVHPILGAIGLACSVLVVGFVAMVRRT